MVGADELQDAALIHDKIAAKWGSAIIRRRI
jgi:hypothetical protein